MSTENTAMTTQRENKEPQKAVFLQIYVRKCDQIATTFIRAMAEQANNCPRRNCSIS